MRAYLREHGYHVAQVTLDFEDYAWNDAYGRCSTKADAAAIEWLKQSYLESAAEYIKLGREEEQIAFGHEIPNVLLLHATAFTTLMLPDLVGLLHKQGFRFATLPKVERNHDYAQDPDAALQYGGTLPDQATVSAFQAKADGETAECVPVRSVDASTAGVSAPQFAPSRERRPGSAAPAPMLAPDAGWRRSIGCNR